MKVGDPFDDLEPISTYGDAQAVDDGALVAVSERDRVTCNAFGWMQDNIGNSDTPPNRWPVNLFPWCRAKDAGARAVAAAQGLIGEEANTARRIYEGNIGGGIHTWEHSGKTFWLIPNEVGGVTLMVPEDYEPEGRRPGSTPGRAFGPTTGGSNMTAHAYEPGDHEPGTDPAAIWCAKCNRTPAEHGGSILGAHTFASVTERDAWLDKHQPQGVSELDGSVPGCTLAYLDGRPVSVAVFCEEVSIAPAICTRCSLTGEPDRPAVALWEVHSFDPSDGGPPDLTADRQVGNMALCAGCRKYMDDEDEWTEKLVAIPNPDADRYVVMCQVSGGVTGTRTGPYKHDDKLVTFATFQEAQEKAAALVDKMNTPHGSASFWYWPAPNPEAVSL